MRPKELMKNLYRSIPDSCPAATCRTQEFCKKQHIKGGDFKIYQTDFSTWGVPILLLLSKRRRRKNTFVKERIRRMWSVSQKIFFGPVQTGLEKEKAPARMGNNVEERSFAQFVILLDSRSLQDHQDLNRFTPQQLRVI
ncbi:hypothetical protein PGT21_002100 [Puccinia graminis f. sp. tritici]|uniref:Uncharacterized protein n=1 Tax=Puccinia graminis f. sp. tritici TaxID=56615 RepID=A0A5B0Q5D3_PUCGR|nr:hypothetical protein PGT21_002100 [Puccinia graminis f. sp. tritici]